MGVFLVSPLGRSRLPMLFRDLFDLEEHIFDRERLRNEAVLDKGQLK